MSPSSSRSRSRFQRGVAAVELAILMSLMFAIMVVPLYFARVYWHYSAAHKAAQDAALYLASVPIRELANTTDVQNPINVAYYIVHAEIAELNPGPLAPVVAVNCDGWPCDGISVPTNVGVSVHLQMTDIMFPDITQIYAGETVLGIRATVTVPYLGR